MNCRIHSGEPMIESPVISPVQPFSEPESFVTLAI